MRVKSVFKAAEVPHLWAAHNRGDYTPAHARSSAYAYRGAVLYADPREHTPVARFYVTPMGDRVVLLCRGGRYSADGALCEGDGRLINVARRVYLHPSKACDVVYGGESLAAMLAYATRELPACDIADTAWFASRHGLDASRMLADAFASVARPSYARGGVRESARDLLDAVERNPYRLAMRGFADAVAAWRWFEQGERNAPATKQTWLRVRHYRDTGPVIQSTRGAEFPIADAVRALPPIRRVRASGGEWNPGPWTDASERRLGAFRINKIDAKGTVTAGCHVVAWPAIEACERQLLAHYTPPLNTVQEG